MAKLTTLFRRLTYKLKYDFFTFDNVTFVAAIALCLIWTWGAISSMSHNWELEQRLADRRRELAILQLQVETAELENEYYRSAEYQELAARRQQNKLLPGETLVYLPKNSPAARAKYQPAPTPEPEPPSNFEQWLSFIFGA